jgi:flagellar hook-associated protein 2
VNVTNDVDKIVENVKKFVEDYNKMLDTMNSKISETRYKDYKPLTDDEKAAMKEDQVKSWEEKAKSGLLNNDTIIRGVVYDMRDALSDSIDGLTGKYTSAASIGITTTSYTEKGKIQLDENKLRNALKEDPDVVYKIFGTTGSDRDSQGIANRLSAVAQTGMTNISKEAGISSSDDQSVLGIKIDSYESQMKKMLDIMDKRQTQLYKQFNAMETAIASLNSQYSFVNQYTSGS